MQGCELDHKEGWAQKNWCFWTLVLEKILESPVGCKIKPVNCKGSQSWIFIGRTEAEAEAPILWSPDVKSWLIRKDLEAGKDWRHEEKGMTEDEMFGWRHWFSGHEFEQALGDGEVQGSLMCCSQWGHKETDTTELLNNTALTWCISFSWHCVQAICLISDRIRVGSGPDENVDNFIWIESYSHAYICMGTIFCHFPLIV